ncbi:MAG: AAA family ATPase [Candidatus Binatia bacterium]
MDHRPPPAPEASEIVHPRFKPLSFLGRGSMGQVYKVHDEEIGVPVALKTLQDFAPAQVYRLKQEFRSLAGVVHPNLVQLFDLVVDETLSGFTMEYVDGVDFVEYVRSAATADDVVARLLNAGVQLLAGLQAVHGAGRLHRDVKPSNVRVTRDGRAVLLDFDLVVAVGAEGESVLPSAAAGTFAYMPPEAMWGKAIGTAADLYAVGVVFYEALTGALPFGPAALTQPSRSLRPMRELVPAVPAWLDELTAGLLQFEPDRRPTLREALEHFHAAVPTPTAVDRPRGGGREFLGRDSELNALREVAAKSRAGGAHVVCVRGPSGMGKTELVRRFFDELERDRVVALRGRCHPRESVPYKAFDAIVDGFSRLLVNLGDAVVQPLVPEHVGALVTVFPVMGRVPAIVAATAIPAATDAAATAVMNASPAIKADDPPEVDATELRRRAFAALRELLGRFAAQAPLVLWIDDLQWGDGDSAALLAELVRSPGAPAVLWIFSYRSEDEAGIAALATLQSLRAERGEPVHVHTITVDALSPEDAEELARRLSPASRRAGGVAAAMAAESRGSPLFVAEMARLLDHRLDAAEGLPPEVRLTDAIVRRIADLPVRARRLVELVAVAGAPLERSVVLQASHDGEAGRAIVALLESEYLVRTTTVGERTGIEAYHDRIRESVLDRLAGEQVTACHAALASALEATGRATPDVLAVHFHGAGAYAKAADCAVAAADKAAEALAFMRAAELYRKARDWDPRDDPWRRGLFAREGDALANAARFAEASDAFLAAVPGAPRQEALELRRRATEQRLAAGRMEEGVALLTALLDDLGLDYPATPLRATATVARELVWFLWHGIEPTARREPATAEELLRVDACYSAGKCLVDADAVRGVHFLVQALRYALRAAEPVRLGCSLAAVGGSLSVIGGSVLRRLGARMVSAAEDLATETRAPLLRGTIDVALGQVAMISGRWQQALEQCDAGAALLAERWRGAAFESLTARVIALRAIEELGDMQELARRGRDLVQNAAELNAVYSEIGASQHLSTASLAEDEVALARPLARKAGRMWTQGGFHLQHLYALRQEAWCDLYEGDPQGAYERVLAIWPALRRSGLMRVSLPRIDACDLRARLTLAVAIHGQAHTARLLRSAERDVRRLHHEGRDDAGVRAYLLTAGIASVRGRRADALAALEQAAAVGRQAGMQLHAATAEMRRGALLGGDEGRAVGSDAADRMRALGVVRPERWVRIYAPGAWE